LVVATAALVAGTLAARADIPGLHHFEPYIDAFNALDRQAFAALVLTLGMVLFALVSAILLVRARARTSATARSRAC